MPGKTDIERVDETVNCIETTTVVPLASRKAAAAVVKLFLADQHTNRASAGFKQMSQNMSLGSRPSGQSGGPRHMARAVYLLWEAIKWKDPTTVAPYASATVVPLTNIDGVLEATIYKALTVYEAAQNRPVAAKYVLDTLFPADPIRFLTYNKIVIAGSPHRDDKQGARNVKDFSFGFDPGKDMWRIQARIDVGCYPFKAASIAATHWTDVPGRTNNPAAGSFAAIDAIEVAGASIVLTTQFTGCTLCFRMSGGSLYGAHVAPGANSTPPILPSGGPALAQQILGKVPGVTGGDFANAPGPPPLTIYGREHSNHPSFPGGYGGPHLLHMSMIGFGTPAGWELFVQEIDVTKTITNVRKIFP